MLIPFLFACYPSTDQVPKATTVVISFHSCLESSSFWVSPDAASAIYVSIRSSLGTLSFFRILDFEQETQNRPAAIPIPRGEATGGDLRPPAVHQIVVRVPPGARARFEENGVVAPEKPRNGNNERTAGREENPSHVTRGGLPESGLLGFL